MKNKTKGYFGEIYACLFLILKGYNILKKNYKTKLGEIDIIAQKGNTLVFAEVKYRNNTKFQMPNEAVNYNKQRHIKNTADIFINKKEFENFNYRFDIIEVVKFKINHIKNAF